MRKMAFIIDYFATLFKLMKLRREMKNDVSKSIKTMKKYRLSMSNPDINLSDEQVEELKSTNDIMKLLLNYREGRKTETDPFLEWYGKMIDQRITEFVEIADDYIKRREANGAKADG